MNNNWQHLRHMMQEVAVLANLLPEWVTFPTRIDYDSEVYGDTPTFEWYAGVGQIMVIFMADGRPSWSGWYDGESSHGISNDCNKIPEECLSMLRSVIDKLNKVK